MFTNFEVYKNNTHYVLTFEVNKYFVLFFMYLCKQRNN